MTMKNKGLIFVLVALFLLLPASASYANPTLDEQIDRLDGHLGTLRDDMHKARQTLGWTGIGLSALPLVYYLILIQSSRTEYDLPIIGSSVILFGGGLGFLLIQSAAEGEYRRFSRQARETEADKVALVAMGEGILSGMATGGTVGRIIGGTVSLAGGAFFAYVIGWSIDSGRFDFGYGMIGVIGAGCVTMALVAYLVPSLAEYEWRAYRDWKAGTGQTALREAGPRVAVIPDLTGMRLRVMF